MPRSLVQTIKSNTYEYNYSVRATACAQGATPHTSVYLRCDESYSWPELLATTHTVRTSYFKHNT